MVKASSLTTVGNLHFLNNKKDSPSQTAGRCNSLAQSRMAWRHLRNYQKVGNSNIELWARVVMKKIDEELDEGELHMDLKLTNIGGIWRGIDSTAISSKSDDFISFILSPFLSHFKGRIAPLNFQWRCSLGTFVIFNTWKEYKLQRKSRICITFNKVSSIGVSDSFLKRVCEDRIIKSSHFLKFAV